jgi:hypothetical protein
MYPTEYEQTNPLRGLDFNPQVAEQQPNVLRRPQQVNGMTMFDPASAMMAGDSARLFRRA